MKETHKKSNNFTKNENGPQEFALKDLKLIGEGACGKVYQVDKNKIIKVFFEGFIVEKIILEYENAKKAFKNNIKTPKCYDVVKIGNQAGIVYEMVLGDTLRNTIKKDKDKWDFYIELYAKFIKKMHSTQFKNNQLMSTKKIWCKNIDFMPIFNDSEKQTVKKMLNAVSDTNTFVHGDCNTGNIIFNNKELTLIDMDAVSIGHPVFDVGGVYFCMKFLGQFLPDEFLEKITGFNKKQNNEMWNKFCEIYFGARSENERIKYENQLKPFAAFGALQVSNSISIDSKTRNSLWKELLKIYFDCCSDKEISEFKRQLEPFENFNIIEIPAMPSPFPKEMLQRCKQIILDANKNKIHTVNF